MLLTLITTHRFAVVHVHIHGALGANVPGQILTVLPTLVARVNSYAFRSRPDGEGQGQVLDFNG
jgi:hypothetical protein